MRIASAASALLVTAILSAGAIRALASEPPGAEASAEHAATADRVAAGKATAETSADVDRAMQFLIAAQSQEGSLSVQLGIGPTALGTLALLRNGRAPDDPPVAKGLRFLEEYVQESGGVYAPGGRISVYETCIALACFQEANRDGRYQSMLKDAQKYLRGSQWTEARGKDRNDPSYGGIGYGGKSRPDLSNTTFLIDALKDCGAGADDPAIQDALVFVSRCQNLESQYNTTPFANKVNDGGFYYTCLVERQDEERTTPDGGLRSYGSMTYSGFKSLVYAGLTPDDPRMKAVLEWIRNHYDVTSNPGMGEAGLYYYYHVFAKALAAAGKTEIVDARGVPHDWKRELTMELGRRQQANGSWVNANPRWMESDANLSTAFALLALSYCRPTAHAPAQ